MARVGVLLIVVALIAGMVGCGGTGGGGDEYYTLTIISANGGTVTTPGEGNLTCRRGTVVNLVAKPDSGYRFGHWIGDVDTIRNLKDAATTIIINYDCTIAGYFDPKFMFAAGDYHTVGLKSDGSVLATGWNAHGQCDVLLWMGITQVSAGHAHTVGLRDDGTVVATGDDGFGQCDVGNWTDITDIAAGEVHTVGLKADGTAVAVGDNHVEQCNVGNWTNITDVAAGWYHTVGLKCDGTVVVAGDNEWGQCNVGNWTDIIYIDAGAYHTMGLKSDHTVVAVGRNGLGECGVDDWTDVQRIAAGGHHSLGLKYSIFWGQPYTSTLCVGVDDYNECSECVSQNEPPSIHILVQLDAGSLHTLGLFADGLVWSWGDNSSGQRDVSGWDLN